MAKKIAVVLSGCGNKDGTEITEAVSLIVALSALGSELAYFAPSVEFHPKNFLTNETMGETRNTLIESARITRSQIRDLRELSVHHFDALALPGGFGAALHLSTWGAQGSKCKIQSDLEKSIKDFHLASKPIAAICIAPVLLAKVLGSNRVTVTIGNDAETIEEVLKTGALHEICPPQDFVTDRMNKVITTPAYMYASAKPHEVFAGIQGLARELVEMA